MRLALRVTDLPSLPDSLSTLRLLLTLQDTKVLRLSLTRPTLTLLLKKLEISFRERESLRVRESLREKENLREREDLMEKKRVTVKENPEMIKIQEINLRKRVTKKTRKMTPSLEETTITEEMLTRTRIDLREPKLPRRTKNLNKLYTFYF